MNKPTDQREPLFLAVQAGREPATRKRVSSAELFGVLRELVIEHAGDEYRLRITSQGKLILTK